MSSRQSCAIEKCTISTDAWTELGEFLREVLRKPLKIAAEKLVSRAFVVPADLLPGEDRDTVQEIANHILVNSWVTARHDKQIEGITLPGLTMSEIRCLYAFQLHNTRSASLQRHGWGPPTVLGDTRLIPIQVASNHMAVFPYPQEINANLQRLYVWLGKYDQASTEVFGLHPLLVAVQLMVYFVGIHPFPDGNGRSSRLLLQDHVYRHGYGYGPVILSESLDRAVYLERINDAANGSPEGLVCMYSYAVLNGPRALRHGGVVRSKSDQ